MLAFAAALAIHEIAAAVVPWGRHVTQTPPETITVAKIVHIERATPTPRPTPKPVIRTRHIAPVAVKPAIVSPAKPSVKEPIKRISSARPIVRTKHHRRPAVHVPVGGHGAGVSKKAIALNGSLGPGGNGTGTNGKGNGYGGTTPAVQPCGEVDFFETKEPTIDESTGQVWEYLMIVVHFPDGTQQAQPLDYPFYYPSRADDPFMQDTKVATFQFPPSAQRADEPALVQYVMQHTTADGFTKLSDCPR